MWKKDDDKEDGQSGTAGGRADEAGATDRNARPTSAAERATIGSSIQIRGEVTGDEDLVIEGDVDGSVELEENSVTVGPDGKVKASIVAKTITVEGRVEGDLRAGEKIVLRSSASVEGDISAPRVELEDGARFRGGVDMEDVSERNRRDGGASPTKSRKAPKPSRASAASIEDAGEKRKSASDPAAEVST